MKIILKSEFRDNIIQTTLDNRNISNLDEFLYPETASQSVPMDFLNVSLGHELLLKHLENKSSIVILVDADADGYTSAAILYQYLLEMNTGADISYIIHPTKAHGLTDIAMEEIYEIEPNLVICPDSSSNDVAQIEELESKGINVLVLDHHNVSEFTDKGVIINNQLCPVTNHNFVGAGVVYKFLQGIDEIKGTNNVEKYLDLVAIGQIGDASDISNPEIRSIVLKGIDNIKNPFLKVALGQDLGFKKIAPKDLSFSVIPLINAVTRIGTVEERELLFEAIAGIGSNRTFPVVKKKKDKTTGKFNNVEFNFSIFEYGYDICTKVKARQNNIIKKMLPIVEENIIDDCGIIIGLLPNDEYPGLSGLIANKLVSKFDKPALLLTEREDTYTGSGRGHEKTMKDFRKWCEDSELVDFAQGHDNAFGIAIRKEDLLKFKEYARKIEKQEIIYEVDIIDNKPSKDDCELVDSNMRLFGGSVSEPLIGLVNLTVPKRFISTKGSVLNIYSWGVGLIQFGHNPNFFEEIMNYPDDIVTFNVVGYYKMNDWSGRKSPQLIIKDIELIYINSDEVNEENIVF